MGDDDDDDDVDALGIRRQQQQPKSFTVPSSSSSSFVPSRFATTFTFYTNMSSCGIGNNHTLSGAVFLAFYVWRYPLSFLTFLSFQSLHVPFSTSASSSKLYKSTQTHMQEKRKKKNQWQSFFFFKKKKKKKKKKS